VYNVHPLLSQIECPPKEYSRPTSWPNLILHPVLPTWNCTTVESMRFDRGSVVSTNYLGLSAVPTIDRLRSPASKLKKMAAS
jgi:hypothetical protein